MTKNFLVKRVLSKFFVGVFSRKVLKIFVEEPFCALFQIVSDKEKFMHKRGRKNQIFPLVIFFHTVPKQFVEEPFSVSLILSIENVLVKRVLSQSSIESFCLAKQKKIVVETFSVSLISCIEKFYA